MAGEWWYVGFIWHPLVRFVPFVCRVDVCGRVFFWGLDDVFFDCVRVLYGVLTVVSVAGYVVFFACIYFM